MDTEQNKAIAQELFARLTASDFAGALDLMADDATWWIAGRKERTPTSGLHSKESIGRLFHGMAHALVGGLKMTVLSCIAEADRVALEVVSRGDLKNGRQYRQAYHMLVQVHHGKVQSVREYLDTGHVHEVFFAPLTEAERAAGAARSEG
jgi:uncharacterized protein